MADDKVSQTYVRIRNQVQAMSGKGPSAVRKLFTDLACTLEKSTPLESLMRLNTAVSRLDSMAQYDASLQPFAQEFKEMVLRELDTLSPKRPAPRIKRKPRGPQ